MNYKSIKRASVIISIIVIITIVIGCLAPSPSDSSSPGPIITTTKQTPIDTVVPKESSSPNPITTQAKIPTILTDCAVVAKGAGTFLHTISDSGQDLPGILIWVTPIAVQCSLRDPTYTNSTNSTGWAYIGSLPANYEFEVSFTYKGKNYNISIPQEPLYKTYATLKLPSGNLTLIVCDVGNICNPY